MSPEDQGEPSGPDWWIWLLMVMGVLFAVAGVIVSLARLFGLFG